MIYYREVDAFDTRERPCISCIEYRVVKETPKGVWIAPMWDTEGFHKKFVLAGQGRRYAYPTKELARASYIIRKKAQIQHCWIQHDRAVERLRYAEGGAPPMPEYFQFDLPKAIA